ncbi:hypothetical protein LSH36_465g01011 [Paralvinella palmiformis]|uniref:NAD(+) kinase n=1 Tax=Paralvinella palmiformis TaxID=53620 RepID=A0AAD9JBB9_9ANNE|nr:hypothetical protein LSH36_465g01011 [Paralvinella palmiformis]
MSIFCLSVLLTLGLSALLITAEVFRLLDTISILHMELMIDENSHILVERGKPCLCSEPESRRRTKSLYGASPSHKFGPKASLMKVQNNVLTLQDPGSQRLTWYKSPLTVLILKKIHDEMVITPFVELVSWLIKERQMVVFVESKVVDDPLLKKHQEYMKVSNRLCTFKEGEDDLTDKIDLIITLGGDGTLLYASTLFQASVPPVMAFHLGSLGFLSPFEFKSDFRDKVNQVLEGNVPLILRTRLKCSVCHKGDPVTKCEQENKRYILMLNELVVDRGVIIATTTGSTAYSAAAGASMCHPNVPAIMITPICPHSLSFRPIVVPAGVEIKIMVSPEARSNAWVSFDGRNRQEIHKGDVIRVSSSIYPLPSICSEDQISDWFSSLAGCLHWNVRKQQKSFTPNSETDSNGESERR